MKGNDFAPLVFIVCYLALTFINFIIFIRLYFLKDAIKNTFAYILCGLLILFIPLLALSEILSCC